MFDMIGNILKSLFAGPATRRYPFEVREPFAGGRGQLTGINADQCSYCGLCQKKCPALAITVDRATKTWTLDPFKCVICGVCVESCPKKCMNMDAHYRTPANAKSSVTASKPIPETPIEVVMPQEISEQNIPAVPVCS